MNAISPSSLKATSPRSMLSPASQVGTRLTICQTGPYTERSFGHGEYATSGSGNAEGGWKNGLPPYSSTIRPYIR